MRGKNVRKYLSEEVIDLPKRNSANDASIAALTPFSRRRKNSMSIVNAKPEIGLLQL